MKIKKRLLSFVLMLFITFVSINGSYKTASATGAEAGAVLALAGGSISTGGALLIVAGLCGAYLGVQYTVTNWDTISSNIASAYDSSTGEVKSWWDSITGNSKSVVDSTKTLSLDKASGQTIDYSKYYLPKSSTIDVNKRILDYTKAAIEDWQHVRTLTKGSVTQTASGRVTEVQKIFEEYNIPFSTTYEFLNTTTYPSLNIIKNGQYFDIVASYGMSRIYTDYKSVNGIYQNGAWVYFGGSWDLFKFNTGSFTGKEAFGYGSPPSYYTTTDGTLFDYTSSDVTAKNLFTYLGPIETLQNGYIYTKSEVRALSNLIYYNASAYPNQNLMKVIDKYTDISQNIEMEYNYTIDASPYTMDVSNPISININDHLLDNIGVIDISKPGTIDIINGAIVSADKSAELDGTDVISVDLVDTTVVENPPVDGTDGGTGWLDKIGSIITGAVQDAFEWLFVPSDAKVNDFITHCKTKMETQTGLLTYPITLVIEFLQKVLILGDAECVFHIPKIEFMGYVLYGGTDYNFTEEVKKYQYAQLYSYYLLITDFIMIIAFLDLAIKRGRELLSGGIE